MADCDIFCLHPAMCRVDGRLGKIQPRRWPTTRNFRFGYNSRRSPVYQPARQHIHLSRMALAVFDTTLGSAGPIHNLVDFCFYARLTRFEIQFDCGRFDGYGTE